MGFPRADPESPLADLGLGNVDTKKPVILVIGHNVPPSAAIIDYLRAGDLLSEVEVTGICCTAIDLTRYSPKAKIIGPISWQLRYIRSGVPDVIVIDEQCVRTDTLQEAAAIHAPLIATSEKNCLGLPDRTDDPVDEIVADFVSGNVNGALILDPEKVGEVASTGSDRDRPEAEEIQDPAVPGRARGSGKEMHPVRFLPACLPERSPHSPGNEIGGSGKLVRAGRDLR